MRTLTRWLMRPARIAAVESLSPRFRLIDIEGDALKDVAWSAGQKVQVSINSGLATRTYTPMSWNAEAGRTRILGFAHGEGPGSRWVQSAAVGGACQFFGPRRSLDLSDLPGPVVLFGDETSFGLAASFRATAQRAGMICVFEVSDAAEARPVLAAIDLEDATLFERQADDLHLTATAAALTSYVGAGDPIILTGKAQSIQSISRALKATGAESSRLKTKAYWAPGKTGLD